MHKYTMLKQLHQRLQPRGYFEIGVRQGRSLAFSSAPSVGVDPYFSIMRELHCDLHLVRATSDEFFARPHPFAHLEGGVFDLAFIDGLHLAEFALRDFINTEKHAHPGTVVVIDDVLPRNTREAAREQCKGAWAGDVFKLVEVLRAERPDLVVLEVDTKPTGTLVVLLPDPGNRVLHQAYDRVVADWIVPDPQVVPDWSLDRRRCIAPTDLLAAPVWDALRRSRRRSPDRARAELRSAIEGAGLAPQGVPS